MNRKLLVVLLLALTVIIGACTSVAAPEPTAMPLVSEDGGMSAELTLSNASDRNIIVSWLDFEGVEHPYKRLKPGQGYFQYTFVGHAWRVRDEASNEIIEDIMIKSREPNKVILIPNSDALGATVVPTMTLAPVVIEDNTGCEIAEPPASLQLPPYFGKYCDAGGISIIAAENVRDEAFYQAWNIVMNMLAPRPDIHEELGNFGTMFAIFGANETIFDLPYYRHLADDEDLENAYAVARGSAAVPITSSGEANLLCWAGWQNGEGYHFGVHEFAHTIHYFGLESTRPEFDNEVAGLYNSAMEEGRYQGVYAATNHREYWTEAVVAYFNARSNATDSWTNMNFVNTRAELKEYDPNLYALVDDVFRGFVWTPSCP